MAHPALDLLFAPPESADERDGLQKSNRDITSLTEARHQDTIQRASSEQRYRTRILAGDPTVFGELYDEYFTNLWGFAFRYTRDRSTAEDIVHDVFLRLWTTRTTVEIQTTVRAYLFGAVRNRALDVGEQKRRCEAVALQPVSGEPFDTTLLPSASQSPHDDAESDDLQRAVMAAVDALPERQQLAFRLRLTNEMTYAEIATVLGVTEGAVFQLIRKGQERLRVALRPFLSDSSEGL